MSDDRDDVAEYRRAMHRGYPDPEGELASLSAGQAPAPRVTFEPTERRVMTDKGAERLISMTFRPSPDGDGTPHVVSRQDNYVRCTCAAMRNIEYRPTGCWAMQEFRRVLGLFEP